MSCCTRSSIRKVWVIRMSSLTRFSFCQIDKKEVLMDFIFLTLSSILTAIAVRFFFAEHTLTPGGITGLAIVLSELTSISVEVLSLMISLPTLLIATFLLGTQFGVKTLYISLTIPLFLKLIPQISITSSTLVAAIIGGVLIGVSIGLACWRKCATGGTDTLAALIQKIIKRGTLPGIILVLDMSIVLSSWLISKQVMTSVYSALSLVVITQVIRYIINNLKKEKKV